MKKIPRVRCPVCGHVVFFRNVAMGLHHRIETFVQTITSGGRGKIRNKFERQFPEGLEDFWIRRLQEVINWLKQNRRIAIQIPVEKTTLRKLETVSSNASGIYALPQKVRLSSKLTKTKTLHVPSYVQTMSLPATKSSLKLVRK